MNPSCEYNSSSAAGHSTLVSIMLDGRGTYGLYEAAGGVEPTDLDACGGHYGPVPATVYEGVTYPAAANVYHYHWTVAVRKGAGPASSLRVPTAPNAAPPPRAAAVQARRCGGCFGLMQNALPPPHTHTTHPLPSIGCFGPVSSTAAAKALYTSCGSGGTKYSDCSSRGYITDYPLFCPSEGEARGRYTHASSPSVAPAQFTRTRPAGSPIISFLRPPVPTPRPLVARRRRRSP